MRRKDIAAFNAHGALLRFPAFSDAKERLLADPEVDQVQTAMVKLKLNTRPETPRLVDLGRY